jgi:hypothetical protein
MKKWLIISMSTATVEELSTVFHEKSGTWFHVIHAENGITECVTVTPKIQRDNSIVILLKKFNIFIQNWEPWVSQLWLHFQIHILPSVVHYTMLSFTYKATCTPSSSLLRFVLYTIVHLDADVTDSLYKSRQTTKHFVEICTIWQRCMKCNSYLWQLEYFTCEVQ